MAVDRPVVSVVIPTYGRPSLLVRAVESALNQTFPDIEVVVVIDGPDPSTSAALDQIDDHRLRIIELSLKVGGAEVRNVGARASRGDWVALLDDDDEWLPSKLEKQLAAAQTADNASVLVSCRYICRAQDMSDAVRPRRMRRAHEPLPEFMFDYLCYLQTSTLMCSRDLFVKVPFDRNALFFQDIDWTLRLSAVEGFELVVVPEPLSIYNMPSARGGITSALDWKSRLQWGQDRRHLISGRAYSNFIVGSCIGRAVQDHAGFEGFRSLFYEAVFEGSATPSLIAILCLAYVLPPQQRKRLRDLIFLRAKKTARPIGSAGN